MAIDRVRGMADIPLTHIGHMQVEHLGARIAAKGGVTNVMASPLLRTRQTAAAVLRHNRNSLMYGVTKNLLPWASGELEGSPISLVKDEMKHYIHNPTRPFPGVSPFSGVPGESLNQYWGRLGPHVLNRMRSLKPGEKALDVSHYRDIQAIRASVAAGGLKNGTLRLNPHVMAEPHNEDKPASIFRISTDAVEPIDINSDKKLEPGYYIARHGATEWSRENNSGEGLKPLHGTPHGNHILKHWGFGGAVA